MEEINALFQGFAVAMTPFNLMLMFVGVTLGVVIGVLPGLGGANGIAMTNLLKPYRLFNSKTERR